MTHKLIEIQELTKVYGTGDIAVHALDGVDASVQQGEFVSYGTTYLATEPKKIAVIPVGYSHGYSRMLSNQGRVLIGGQRIAVIGMVNMNMLIADVTNIPDVKLGDEVIIIGRQQDLEISVASFSEISDQVNYELLVRLPVNTCREVVN